MILTGCFDEESYYYLSIGLFFAGHILGPSTAVSLTDHFGIPWRIAFLVSSRFLQPI